MLPYKYFPRQQKTLQLTTASRPPVDQSVYLKPPSVTKAPFKKSRRTQRKHPKKPWRFKEPPTYWKYLAKQPGWNKLSEDTKMQLMLGWPNRHFCLSYQEIALGLGKSTQAAKRLIAKWERKCDIKKTSSFLERHGKVTGIHRKNYYVFTEKRKVEIEGILIKYFKNRTTKGLNFVKSFCQGDSTSATASDSHVFSAPEQKVEVELKSEIVTMFDMFDFAKELPKMPSDLKLKVNEKPIKQLVSILKWLKMKLKKNWKCRSFWATFRWLIKNGVPKPWLKKRSEEYLSALAGTHTMNGVDSQTVVEQILEIQKKTGLEVTERDLRKLLSYGTIHLTAYLKVVDFKSNAKPIENWISYTHFLAKQPAHELAKMYQPKEPPKDETTLEWTKRYLKKHKKKLTIIASEAAINRNVRQATTKPGVLLQMHAEEDKSVLKIFQKVQGEWIDRTIPLNRSDFKEAVTAYFEGCFKEVRISNANFFAGRARKKKLPPPKETLEWCKSFLGTIKDKVRFLSPGKSVVRDIEAKQAAPIIDLKIHKEVAEKSVLKIHQKVNGEWLDKEYRFNHPDLQKELERHFNKALSV